MAFMPRRIMRMSPGGSPRSIQLSLPASSPEPEPETPEPLAISDFKSGVYSANAGAITTLGGMWQSLESWGVFDTAHVVADVGLVYTEDNDSNPALTTGAMTGLTGGATMIGRYTSTEPEGAQFTIGLFDDPDLDYFFFAALWGIMPSMADNNEVQLDYDDVLPGDGEHEFYVTVTPTKLSMRIDDGEVQTTTPLVGATFTHIGIDMSAGTVVEYVEFHEPVSDELLATMEVPASD
jgi:hypothetical protein